MSDFNIQISLPTCEHAFVDNTGAADEHGITWHNGPIAGDDDHITGHEIGGQNLLYICKKDGWPSVGKLNVCINTYKKNRK